MLFPYKSVLAVEIGWVDGVTRAKRPEPVPVVMTREEVAAALQQLKGRDWLMASLMYGTGLRLLKWVQLRVQAVDFGYRQIPVHGGKDRFVPLPAALISALQEQIRMTQRLLAADLAPGFGEVSMPEALVRKYPRAPFELKRWCVFPSTDPSVEPVTKRIKRHHVDPSNLQKAMRAAVLRTGAGNPAHAAALPSS